MKIAEKLPEALKKYKLPILAATVGLVLLLIPTSGNEKESVSSDEDRLEALLEVTEGVGETRVLISENGAVIVCEGAEKADVRLTVMNAASAFTGYTFDNIQIFKLETED